MKVYQLIRDAGPPAPPLRQPLRTPAAPYGHGLVNRQHVSNLRPPTNCTTRSSIVPLRFLNRFAKARK